MQDTVRIEGVDHFFGRVPLRRQILFGLSATVRAGEIVILTGPSGSGKTTALTLIGALRSVQGGSLEVLGHQLAGAGKRGLVEVRRQIGYIFQHHNLLDALTAGQNVEIALQVHPGIAARERRRRAAAMLEAVGLAEHVDAHPDRLSGGQKQRVAIARALVGQPNLVLADEPTASLWSPTTAASWMSPTGSCLSTASPKDFRRPSSRCRPQVGARGGEPARALGAGAGPERRAQHEPDARPLRRHEPQGESSRGGWAPCIPRSSPKCSSGSPGRPTSSCG